MRDSTERNAKGEKYCAKGDHWVPVDQFQKGKYKDGLINHCRACGTEYKRQQRARSKS